MSLLHFSKSYLSQLVYIILLPAFFIAFCLIYNPFDIQTLYQVGGHLYPYHLLMLTCILIGTLGVSRSIFFVLNRHIDFQWWEYAAWCILEVLAAAFFFALYTSLFYDGELPYFMALSKCITFLYLILIFPYLLLSLLNIIQNQSSSLLLRDADGNVLVKFYDEHKALRLTIVASAILYISAESNYIKVHYLDGDKATVFILRNSMKSVEPIAAKYGLVRCHRSYYVNPRYIKVLSRSRYGVIKAEFSHDGVEPVPVSKLYYQALANLL